MIINNVSVWWWQWGVLVLSQLTTGDEHFKQKCIRKKEFGDYWRIFCSYVLQHTVHVCSRASQYQCDSTKACTNVAPPEIMLFHGAGKKHGKKTMEIYIFVYNVNFFKTKVAGILLDYSSL